MEKIEEPYDKAKYISLLKTITDNDLYILKALLDKFKDLPDRSALFCIRLCE